MYVRSLGVMATKIVTRAVSRLRNKEIEEEKKKSLGYILF